ncbi:MAG: hypothetical protein HFG80_11365 [Eubacterium sp.]|nr:hypothetical protein [Eubacterium sp.]
MKHAVIDVGSNSMRLTVYDVKDGDFRILFKEKIMAGLAGYVENRQMTQKGIDCAAEGILHFREILKVLSISDCTVLATASLRNIRNTKEAREQIDQRTGITVQVLTGEEEATFGYLGAMHDLQLKEGIFVDIGGGSTEIVKFEKEQIEQAKSYPVGSLMLYREYVKKILPGKKSQKKIKDRIMRELLTGAKKPPEKGERIAGVGGTIRAVLKLAVRQFELHPETNSFSAEQLEHLCTVLCKKDKTASDLIIQIAPERIHTLIPGMLILQKIVRLSGAKEIVVSRYSIREGYLCRKIAEQ